MRGARTRFSTTTNPTTDAAEITKQTRVGALSQPQLAPSVTAKTNGTSTAAISTVPARSTDRGRVGSSDSGTVRRVSGTHSRAITASIQNSPCHPVTSTSAPPTKGPAAAPAADAAPHSDTARICASPPRNPRTAD